MSKLTFEQITEELTGLKAKRKEVNNAIGAIRLKHKVAKGEKPKEKKLAIEWNKLHEEKAELTGKIEKLEAKATELKPKKERETKYNYPADCVTAADKKAFRTKMRAQANAAEKGEKKASKKAEKEKPSKKAKEVPAEAEAPAKSAKKDKKSDKKRAKKNQD